MTRFVSFLNELASDYGKGITFIDIDETILHTFALIYVIDDKTGKIVKKLNNQEFNTYKLPSGHHFDFREFRNAEVFRQTSKPINKTIQRIKRMFQNIDYRGSNVVLLTARETFDNMKEFNQTFKDYGIPIDKIDVELAGDLKTGSISQRKKRIIMKYVSSAKYRRVRLIDDSLENIKDFLTLQYEIPDDVINKVKKKHKIPENEDFPVIQFYGLLVKDDGSLKRVK